MRTSEAIGNGKFSVQKWRQKPKLIPGFGRANRYLNGQEIWRYKIESNAKCKMDISFFLSRAVSGNKNFNHIFRTSILSLSFLGGKDHRIFQTGKWKTTYIVTWIWSFSLKIGIAVVIRWKSSLLTKWQQLAAIAKAALWKRKLHSEFEIQRGCCRKLWFTEI